MPPQYILLYGIRLMELSVLRLNFIEQLELLQKISKKFLTDRD